VKDGRAVRAEEVPEGLDLGVSRMKSGEKAELMLSPAYGFKDQVPRGALRPGAVLAVRPQAPFVGLAKDQVARGPCARALSRRAAAAASCRPRMCQPSLLWWGQVWGASM